MIQELGLSVRAFSARLGVPDSNTRNYLDKGTKLNSEYLESIALHFSNINLTWLITGNGEPFLSANPNSTLPTTNAKNFSDNVFGNKNNRNVNQGDNNINASGDYEQKLAAAQAEITNLRTQVEGLNNQLADRERIIEAKNETINLLRAAFDRPN